MSCHLLCDTHRHHQVEGGGGGRRGEGRERDTVVLEIFASIKFPGYALETE